MDSIYLQTSTFSPPWSVLTCAGDPKEEIPSINDSNTVVARLLSAHLIKIIVRENPSTPACMTNLHGYHQYAKQH